MATHGLHVVGVDVNPHIVNTINSGRIHIVEPELDALVSGVVSSKRLRATLQPEEADAFIIAVPTPFHDDNAPDLSYIQRAAGSIALLLRRGNVVILESTSPVGATEQLTTWLAAARPDLRFPQLGGDPADVYIVYCPERVLPGRVLVELVENDRILGGMTAACSEQAMALYSRFVRGRCIISDPRTAEMAKLTENAYRDVNIAFANELSLICDKLDINVWELIELANRHPRVNILQPGPGVGGHCIAVDPWFIVHSAPGCSRLIRTAREINDAKPHYIVEHVAQLASRFSNPVIACLGLSYKPDIDDLRESPAVDIVVELASRNVGQLLVCEPHISELPAALASFGTVELCAFVGTVQRADIIVLLVNHRHFRHVDRRLLLEKIVVDTRGMWR
jgi:UDP-N-acetyl-D-mannosaminuronic acid dehydrogenase